MTPAARVSRRRFLAATGGLAARGIAVRAQPGPAPREADVVVIGGDPAALATVYRLSRTPGLRVVLVDDRPAYLPVPPPPGSIAAAPPFARGHQVCFDSWRDAGNPGWGYEDVLPSFKRLEKYEAGASEYRGGEGPVSVAHCWDPHPLHRAFLLAAVSGGFQQDSRHDFNGPRSQGIAGYYQKAIVDDRPQTFTEALLDPAATAGVTIVRAAVVTRVDVERGRAVGVEYAAGGTRTSIRATRGVVVAAAPVRAAQILMLSGIGPAAHLRERGIAVAVDRPGVGRNLHQHLRVSLRWQALPPAQSLPESTVSAGMFTVSLHASPPDLQMDFLDPRATGAPLLGTDITLVQPASRGELRLASADPDAAPLVTARDFSAEADVIALVQGIRLSRLTAASPQLDRMRGEETAATRGPSTQADLLALVQTIARPTGAVAGTCAMGRAANADAVVDATLAVHGVDGLRVAGAAVMPAIVNAPPEAAALMIGDRAADFVLAGR